MVHDLVERGLLTRAEVEALVPMQNKIQDTMPGWVGLTITDMRQKGQIQPSAAVDELLAGVCSRLGRFADLFSRDSPNSWTATMLLVTDTLLLMVNLRVSMGNHFT